MSAPRFSTELRGLGLHGAHYFVRQYPFDTITRVLAEVLAAQERGDAIGNPAGMLVWLVRQAQLAGDEDGGTGGSAPDRRGLGNSTGSPISRSDR